MGSKKLKVEPILRRSNRIKMRNFNERVLTTQVNEVRKQKARQKEKLLNHTDRTMPNPSVEHSAVSSRMAYAADDSIDEELDTEKVVGVETYCGKNYALIERKGRPDRYYLLMSSLNLHQKMLLNIYKQKAFYSNIDVKEETEDLQVARIKLEN